MTPTSRCNDQTCRAALPYPLTFREGLGLLNFRACFCHVGIGCCVPSADSSKAAVRSGVSRGAPTVNSATKGLLKTKID